MRFLPASEHSTGTGDAAMMIVLIFMRKLNEMNTDGRILRV
jgi:hypothetical protein